MQLCLNYTFEEKLRVNSEADVSTNFAICEQIFCVSRKLLVSLAWGTWEGRWPRTYWMQDTNWLYMMYFVRL